MHQTHTETLSFVPLKMFPKCFEVVIENIGPKIMETAHIVTHNKSLVAHNVVQKNYQNGSKNCYSDVVWIELGPDRFNSITTNAPCTTPNFFKKIFIYKSTHFYFNYIYLLFSKILNLYLILTLAQHIPQLSQFPFSHLCLKKVVSSIRAHPFMELKGRKPQHGFPDAQRNLVQYYCGC